MTTCMKCGKRATIRGNFITMKWLECDACDFAWEPEGTNDRLMHVWGSHLRWLPVPRGCLFVASWEDIP
jgi:hypothetical protein